MLFKSTSNYTVGLDIQPSLTKVAYLSLKNKKIRTELLLEITSKDFTENASNVKKLCKINQKALLISMIPTERLIARPLSLNLSKRKDLDSVLKHEIEPFIPFPIEETIFDRIIHQQSKEKSSLSVFAAKESDLQKHLDSLKKRNLYPEAVSCAPIALTAFVEWEYGSKSPLFILHMEEAYSLCVLSEKGKPINSHYIEKGQRFLIDALSKDLKTNFHDALKFFNEKSVSQFIQNKKDACFLEAIEQYKQEIKKTFLSLAASHNIPPPKTVILTGSFTKLPPKIKQFEYISIEKNAPFALSIGLALSHLENKSEVFNFRKKNLPPPLSWKRLKKTFLTFFFLLSFFIGSSRFLSEKILEQKRNAIYKQYSLLKNQYFFLKKTPPQPQKQKNGNLKNLHLDLSSLEKALRSYSEMPLLQANIPKVSEFIQWINASSLAEAPLLIDQLSYSMPTFPSIGKANLPYKVKIEIVFRAPSPLTAQKFKKALLSFHSPIDQEKNISWSNKGDVYQTSFFLKNQQKGSF